jgi:3'-5' exoribonuclease
MTLSDIDLIHGTQFSCECRVRQPLRKIATNGSKYLSFVIEDCSMSFKAYAWPERFESPVFMDDLDKVLVEGNIREFNGGWLAGITSIQHISLETENSLQLISNSMCPLSPLLERLRNIIAKISNDSLRRFIGWVFSDDSFVIPFISAPASRRHHHSVAGGLLEHSLECAEMVSRFREFGQGGCDLAVVGALLHDVGKIITFRNVVKFSSASYALDHDALTLEIMAPHLKRLDEVNSDLATALRYIWTWKNHKRGNVHPILIIVEAISAADRISSALSVEEEAFRESPDWRRFARHEIGKSSFWRPRFDKDDILEPVFVSRN